MPLTGQAHGELAPFRSLDSESENSEEPELPVHDAEEAFVLATLVVSMRLNTGIPPPLRETNDCWASPFLLRCSQTPADKVHEVSIRSICLMLGTSSAGGAPREEPLPLFSSFGLFSSVLRFFSIFSNWLIPSMRSPILFSIAWRFSRSMSSCLESVICACSVALDMHSQLPHLRSTTCLLFPFSACCATMLRNGATAATHSATAWAGSLAGGKDATSETSVLKLQISSRK